MKHARLQYEENKRGKLVQKRLLALGIIIALIGIILISFSKIETSQAEGPENTVLGDIIWKEGISIDEYRVSADLKSGDNITIGLWAGNDWGQQKSFDPGDDLHPYPHRDVFILIKDSEGKNTTLEFPFTTGHGGAVAYDPNGIHPLFQDVGLYYWNGKEFGIHITKDDHYTVEFMGYYPPTQPPAEPIEPPYRFKVTKISPPSNTATDISFNYNYISFGTLLCTLGIIISVIGFKSKPKRKPIKSQN